MKHRFLTAVIFRIDSFPEETKTNARPDFSPFPALQTRIRSNRRGLGPQADFGVRRGAARLDLNLKIPKLVESFIGGEDSIGKRLLPSVGVRVARSQPFPKVANLP